MPEGHDATIEVCNIMSFVLYTQILKQSVLKPTSPGITLKCTFFTCHSKFIIMMICYMYLSQEDQSSSNASENGIKLLGEFH